MDTDTGKTNNIYFPLCFLSFREDSSIAGEDVEYIPSLPEIAELIISYGIVEYAMKLQRDDFFISQLDESKIKKFTKQNSISVKSGIDKYIILSSVKLGITFNDMKWTKGNHAKLSLYLQEYEAKHGKDAIVKMHSGILFHVRDKTFDERMFRVYCAVVSVIGNKDYVKIIMETISYRLHGYKTKEIYSMYKPSYEVLTDKKIKTTLHKLQKKKCFYFITYNCRLTYYSRKLDNEKLLNVIAEKKAREKFKKSKSSIANKILTEKVNERVLQLEKEYKKHLKDVSCE